MWIEPPPRRPRWPGWDGGLLVSIAVAMVAAWLWRGRLGGEERLVFALVASLAWVAGTRWTRRPPRLSPKAGFRPVVVIPAKDNAGTVARVARASLAHCDAVVVLDDGSDDGTAQAVAAVDGVTLLRHRKNLGKGAALASALSWAHDSGFSHAVCLDADGQHDPADIPAFVRAAREHPDAVHVGVRDMSTAPGSSQFGRRFSNFWIHVETGHVVGDSQCGFRAYPIARTLTLGLGAGRYEWEVEVLVRGLWAGTPVRDLPCRVYYPPPEERVSSFRMFWDNVRISWLNTRLVVARLLWPPRWWNRARPARQWQGGHLGVLWGWTLFLWILRLFGRWPTYAVMAVMAAFYTVFAPRHREGLLAYLRRARAAGVDVGTGWWTCFRAFHVFANSLVDRFLLLVKGPGAFHFAYEGIESTRACLRESGAIFLSAHLGNPELGATGLQGTEYHRPVNVLQFTHGEDPYLALLRRHLKGACPPRILSLNAGDDLAGVEAVRALRRGEIVAIKGDRVIDDRVVEVDFLGGRLPLPAGPFLLAAASRAPVVLLGCFKEGAHSYRIITTEPRVYAFGSRASREADLRRWAQEFADTLAAWVRRYPLQYYNFHDPWLD